MSDFDKEAEREKLREKYERDREERQATQRMSDLLLKGATMTNAHCGTCGDPLFQMDGTTFCPSCHGNPDAVEGTDLEAQPAEESPADAGDGATADAADADRSDSSGAAEGAETPETADSSARPDRRPDQSTGTPDTTSADAGATVDSSPEAGSTSASEAPTTADSSDRRSSEARAESSRSSATAPDRGHRSTGDDRRSTGRSGGPSRTADGDLAAARDSLVAALEKFAAEAAATDDPRYARECLEAAREAGETLETLR